MGVVFKEMTSLLERDVLCYQGGRWTIVCVTPGGNSEGGDQNRVRKWLPLSSKIVKVLGKCFLLSGLKGCMILKVFIFVDLSQRWRAGKIAKNRQEAI